MRRRRDANTSTNRAFDAERPAHYRQTGRTKRGPTQRQIASVEAKPEPTPRVASVDALRGFSMLCILGMDSLAKSLEVMLSHTTPWLAAIGSAIGLQFSHAKWEGAYFYDLVFPLFIFVTGISIVFSLTKLVTTKGRFEAHKRVIRRAVLLFAFGIVAYGGISENWSDIRLGGVLQRIALCYLFASLMFLNLSLRGMIAGFFALLVGYWALLTFVPVPQVGAGSFEEGRNLANWIDANYLPGRKWEGTWDPEGILSTLPAICTCLLGVFAGLLLKNNNIAPQKKSLWLIGAGFAMLAAGLIWHLQFPIIKQIWTSSFVLVAGAFALLLLGAFHFIMDVRGYKAWALTFMWVGASAIVLYMFNIVFGFHILAQRLVGGDLAQWLNKWVAQGAGDFVGALVGLGIAIAAARFLYRRKIFLRV